MLRTMLPHIMSTHACMFGNNINTFKLKQSDDVVHPDLALEMHLELRDVHHLPPPL